MPAGNKRSRNWRHERKQVRADKSIGHSGNCCSNFTDFETTDLSSTSLPVKLAMWDLNQ